MKRVLGEAPAQAERLLGITSDQQRRLFEAEKRAAELEQQLAEMSRLSSKVTRLTYERRETRDEEAIDSRETTRVEGKR